MKQLYGRGGETERVGGKKSISERPCICTSRGNVNTRARMGRHTS